MWRLTMLVGLWLGTCAIGGGLTNPGPTEIPAVAEYPYIGRGVGVQGPFGLLASRSPFPALVDGAVTPLTLVDDEWVRGIPLAPPSSEATVFGLTTLLKPAGACVFGYFGQQPRLWIMRRVGSELEFDARIDFTQFTGIRDFDATDDLSLVAIADWTFSNNGGRVLVFERAGTSYSLVQTITGSTLLGPNQRLGRDVRFHGDRMYVASRMFRFDPDSGEPTYGAVHIFERINGAWEVVDTVFPAPPSILSTGFGTAMYVDDDLIVVSARTDSSQSSNQGSVWIFEQDGGIWRNTQRIRPYDGVSQDGFGAHVARSDGQLLIVADSTDISGPRSGAVYRYRKIENLWTPCERFASPYSPDPDEFGLAFDASNEVIVVSAPLVFPAPNGRVLAFKAELTPAPPSAFTLAGPADGAVELGTTLALLWNAALEVGGYRVDVASDPAFSAMMYTVEVGASDTSLLVPEGVLEDGRRYYWRVAALNDIGQTLNAGGPWTFRTRLLGDLNGSCSVTFEDLNGVLATFGQSGPDLYGDANGDGITDFSDLNLVLSNFGRTCDE